MSAKTIELPLLHDNHTHPSIYAALDDCPNLTGLRKDEAMDILKACPADRLSVARGHRTNEFDFTREDLAVLPPVLVINFSFHGFTLSDAGVPFVAPRMPGIGERRFDRQWCEEHLPSLLSMYGEFAGLDEAKLERYMDGLEAVGIGSAEDMAISCPEALERILASEYAEKLPVWVAYDDLPRFRSLRGVAGVKFFLDGALGARTAALSGGWIGAWKAVTCHDDAGLFEKARAAMSVGALSIHAIGDLAVDQALRAAKTVRADGFTGLIRFEHAQFVTPAQARACRDLGVVLSMQPNFSPDSDDYADRLSDGLRRSNNPFRMLIDEVGFVPGRDLIFGSDGMPHGVPAAFGASLFPAYPGQRLSLDELVAGYGPSRGKGAACRIVIDEAARTVKMA